MSHCSRATCIIHTLCMPLTIIVATVRQRDMMTMIQMKTNDTMQKTENTMDEASECVPARAFHSHVPRRMRTHDAKHLSAKQEPFHHPDGHGTITLLTPNMSSQLAGPIERSVDLRQRGSRRAAAHDVHARCLLRNGAKQRGSVRAGRGVRRARVVVHCARMARLA